VSHKTGSGLDDWIYWHLIDTTQDYRQYAAISDLHTLQLTVTHAQGFSVFTSPILATDLSQSHCHFKSHMKSSCHSLIPFLTLFCDRQFWRLESISSSAPKFISWQAGVSKLDSTRPRLLKWNLLYNNFARITQKTHALYFLEGAFTAPLHSKRKLLDCCLRIRCHGDVFTASFPRNERLFWSYFSGFQWSCRNIFYFFTSVWICFIFSIILVSPWGSGLKATKKEPSAWGYDWAHPVPGGYKYRGLASRLGFGWTQVWQRGSVKDIFEKSKEVKTGQIRQIS
jgi:hypothetical protein